MSYTVPALRGRMGSTTYYQATVTARDLAGMAKTAAELKAWKDWSVFERFQRDLATSRVEREIVPYLVRTKDRFFGALIVLVYEPDVFDFDPVPDVPTGGALRAARERMGFLTVSGGELVVLDGQHRLSALRAVVTAGDELQGEFRDEIVDDELCVMFIHHESFEKTRRIFNKVNRYARPTSTSDNIITSEDDGLAIVTRWLVEPEPPLGLEGPLPPLSGVGPDGEPLVEWRKTTLATEDAKVTTLSSLYQTVEAILHANGISDFDEKHRVNRPDDDELELAYVACAVWWQKVLDGVHPFRAVLDDPRQIAGYRRFQSSHSLLMRPAAQVSMFWGLAAAVLSGLPLDDAVARLDKLDWSAANPLWSDTVVYSNGRIKVAGVKLAARLICYLILGESMSEAAQLRLRNDLAEAKDEPDFRLPVMRYV